MAKPSVLITTTAVAGLLVSGILLMMAPNADKGAGTRATPSASPRSLSVPTPLEPITTPAEPQVGPPPQAQIPQAPNARPAPPAAPSRLRDFKTWEGPDQAVASWYSERCGREVLRFGAQQYSKGAVSMGLPPDVQDLGYFAGVQKLYGNRGAPGTVYVTSDGNTFSEWLAVAESC